MRKIILSFILSFLLLLPNSSRADVRIRTFIKNQDGTSGALDSVSCNVLATNHLAIVFDVNNTRILFYKYNNDDSCEADSEPNKIAPDDCSTCSNKGQWELVSTFVIGASDCSGITSGCCLDLDDGRLHCWDGDSVEITGVLDFESKTSNDFDPDRLAGDTTDDDLIDVNVLGPFGAIQMDGTPGTDDTYAGSTITGWNCGESIEQWDLVYLDDTENEWMEADADTSGKYPAVGMAVAACTDGNAGTILLWGVVRNDDWTWTGNGKKLYLDETITGGLTETIPTTTNDCVQLKAYSLDDDHIILIPSITYTLVQ